MWLAVLSNDAETCSHLPRKSQRETVTLWAIAENENGCIEALLAES